MKKRGDNFRVVLFVANLFRTTRSLILRIRGYDIHKSTIIEGSVLLDKLNPKGIHIGANTLVARGAVILSHDHCKRADNNQPFLVDTYIGERSFIAIGAIVLPGITIGDEVIIGAGAVVTKDIPSNCVAAGNPARIIRTGIKMNDFASLINWDKEKGWID